MPATVPTVQDYFSGIGNKEVSRMLSVQYRMNQQIMEWSSLVMYGGNITAHPSVANHTLADIGVSNPSPPS